MELFAYRAISDNGKEKKGSISAETREEAFKELKDQGLIPLSLTTQNFLDKDIKFSYQRKKKISSRDLSVFCRQFSSIMRAGVSVINALSMLSEQTENKVLRIALKNVQSNVEKGETLASAMRLESSFPSLLVNMVSAGEASGSLETAINRMAVQFEKDAKLKGMVKKAMMYPIVLSCVAVVVIIVMLAYVIPNFMSMFKDLDADMPAFTAAVISLSEFLQSRWYIIAVIIAALVFIYNMYAKTENGKRNLAGLKLKIPVMGALVKKTACARFSRTLSTLLTAGMPMIEALDITANAIDNVLYRDALMRVKNGVGLGMDISSQLKTSGLFTSMVVHMTNIGEETGNIEEMLTNVANYYDEEVEITTQQLTAMMEPAIIVVMAGIVGLLIVAMYSPMIELYNTLG